MFLIIEDLQSAVFVIPDFFAAFEILRVSAKKYLHFIGNAIIIINAVTLIAMKREVAAG